MLKSLARAGLVAAVAAAIPAPCRAGRPSVLVTVNGFSQRTGNVRVAIYGSDPGRFLQRGQTVRKVDLPVSRAAGPMRICVALPAPGQYAVAVRHDVDGNGRSGWNDGGGFSRNPRLSLVSLRPRYQNVAVNVGQGTLGLNVTLLYRYGLSIRPANG
jgi:uncharacterized protein (DUF2141 family)